MEHWNVEACAVKLERSALEVWKMNALLRLQVENWSFKRFLTWKIHAGSVENEGLKCGNWTLKVWKNCTFQRDKLELEVWKMKAWNVENWPPKVLKNTLSNVENRPWKCGQICVFKCGKSALEVWNMTP